VSLGLLEAVELGGVRVVERRQHLRFARQSHQAIGLVCSSWLHHLDRDVAIQPAVPGTIHLAHPTLAEDGLDLIGTNASASNEWHVVFAEVSQREFSPDQSWDGNGPPGNVSWVLNCQPWRF
jgi:hypothetical protein